MLDEGRASAQDEPITQEAIKILRDRAEKACQSSTYDTARTKEIL